jgi:DNA polymerase III sliding clamp (beta) subunit (PCNA family)
MSKTSKTITVGAARFGAEAAWIAKATPKSGYIPLFKTVQVGVDDGVLTLRRTNLDVFAHTALPGSGGAAAAILVDAGQLVAALKGAGGDAKVDVADDRLRLAIGGRILSLTAAAVGDEQFPAWPDFTPAADGVILRAPQLARALTSVSDDATVPQLGGVKFEDGKMLSTDRFRLTRIRYDDDGFTALIPAGVLRPFASGTELVRVEHGKRNDGNAVEGSMVRLSNWGYSRTITGLVLDADFPKWQRLIPDAEQMPVSVLLPRRQLLDAVGAGDDVTLTVAADGAQVLVVSTDRDGSMEVEQGVKVIRCIRGDGLPFTIRLNARNLAECLKAVSAGAVQLMATAPDKPILLQFSDDLHLIMPIRISA